MADLALPTEFRAPVSPRVIADRRLGSKKIPLQLDVKRVGRVTSSIHQTAISGTYLLGPHLLWTILWIRHLMKLERLKIEGILQIA